MMRRTVLGKAHVASMRRNPFEPFDPRTVELDGTAAVLAPAVGIGRGGCAAPRAGDRALGRSHRSGLVADLLARGKERFGDLLANLVAFLIVDVHRGVERAA